MTDNSATKGLHDLDSKVCLSKINPIEVEILFIAATLNKLSC